MPGSFVFILTVNQCKMILKITSTLRKSEYTFNNLEDKLVSRLFYAFDITIPAGVLDGEYQYVLTTDEGEVKATGLLQIGDYQSETKPYTGDTIKENNGFISYNG